MSSSLCGWPVQPPSSRRPPGLLLCAQSRLSLQPYQICALHCGLVWQARPRHLKETLLRTAQTRRHPKSRTTPPGLNSAYHRRRVLHRCDCRATHSSAMQCRVHGLLPLLRKHPLRRQRHLQLSRRLQSQMLATVVLQDYRRYPPALLLRWKWRCQTIHPSHSQRNHVDCHYQRSLWERQPAWSRVCPSP